MVDKYGMVNISRTFHKMWPGEEVVDPNTKISPHQKDPKGLFESSMVLVVSKTLSASKIHPGNLTWNPQQIEV